MFRTIILAAALGAMALPAGAATSITVNITGLDAKAVHTTIVHAAQAACRIELRDDSPLELVYSRPECMSDAVAGAEARLAAKSASLSTDPSRLASR